MLLLLAGPSPVPIIINMPESGSPWWGVPAITASAVLFGALVAFLSARASDGRKARRDEAERIMIDTRTVGLEYLDAATDLANIIRTQQDPSRALSRMDYPPAIQAAILTAHSKWGKFELFAHDDALATGGKLNIACTVLAAFAFRQEHPVESLRDFEMAKYAFMNTIRKASGVGEISLEIPDPETSNRLKAAGDAIIDGVVNDITKNYGPGSKK